MTSDAAETTEQPQRVTLDAAAGIARACQRAVRRYGWSVALYGSTLHRGEGNDIDLLAVTFGGQVGEIDDMLDRLVAAVDGEIVERNPCHGGASVIIELRDGRLIDLKVRP